MPDINPTTPPCTNPDCADAKGRAAALGHQNTRLDQEITRLNREITRLTELLDRVVTENVELTQSLGLNEAPPTCANTWAQQEQRKGSL